jgi:hypothetical protein
MRDNYFWRIVVVCAVLSVFYLGHGLHNGSPSGGLQIIGSARAGGITTRGETSNAIFTTNQDGKTVYVWRQAGPFEVKFQGSATAK